MRGRILHGDSVGTSRATFVSRPCYRPTNKVPLRSQFPSLLHSQSATRNTARAFRGSMFAPEHPHFSRFHSPQGSLLRSFRDTGNDRPFPSPSSPLTITSPKNPTVKQIRSLLGSRKRRTEAGLTVIEGSRLVMDLVRDRPEIFEKLLLTEEAWERYGPTLTEAELNGNVEIVLVTEEVLKVCSDTVTPQGILATCHIPQENKVSQSLPPLGSDSGGESGMVLVLDGISDPGNMGTLLRSAAAVGVTGVVLYGEGTTDPWSPKVVRSSMGASFAVPLQTVPYNTDLVEALQRRGCHTVYAAAASSPDDPWHSTPYDKVDFCGGWEEGRTQTTKTTALCIGNEASGLSAPVVEAVREGRIGAVHIPMELSSNHNDDINNNNNNNKRPVVESLNAAVCGSVLLFEYYRQKRRMMSRTQTEDPSQPHQR